MKHLILCCLLVCFMLGSATAWAEDGVITEECATAWQKYEKCKKDSAEDACKEKFRELLLAHCPCTNSSLGNAGTLLSDDLEQCNPKSNAKSSSCFSAFFCKDSVKY